jgi:hypothetical protein
VVGLGGCERGAGSMRGDEVVRWKGGIDVLQVCKSDHWESSV